VQGYRMSRPMPAAMVQETLKYWVTGARARHKSVAA